MWQKSDSETTCAWSTEEVLRPEKPLNPLLELKDSIVAGEIGFCQSAGATSLVSKSLGTPHYVSSKAPFLYARDLSRYKRVLLYHSLSAHVCVGSIMTMHPRGMDRYDAPAIYNLLQLHFL